MNRRNRTSIAIAAAVTALLAIAGASSAARQDARAGAPKVAEAKRLLAHDRAAVKWKTPGPALAVGTKVKGKSMFYLANGLSLPFTQSLVKGVKDAAAVVGLNVTFADGAGSASKAARLIEQAIGRKVDVIVVQSFPTSAITAPIKAAKAAGIPVIQEFETDPRLPTAKEVATGVRAHSGFCFTCVGRSIASYIVAESNGKANVVVFDVPEVGVSGPYRGVFVNELRRLCPSCKSKVVDAPLAQWQTGLPNLTTSVLKADPGVNFLFPLYDGMVASMKPSVFALNKDKSVKIVSYNADLPNMQAIQKGNDPEVADVGGSPNWAGWAVVDQSLRILLGKPPVASENVPNRTFDGQNIKSIDLKKDESTWYGGVDYRGNYKKLWDF